MNSHDLLEQRSERGDARGPAHVWTSAQPDLSSLRVGHWSAMVLRAVLVCWLIGLGGLVVTQGGQADINPAQSDDQSAPLESSEPLPKPLLIDAMSLQRVSRPFDPGYDGDDILDGVGFSGDRTEMFRTGEADSITRTVVFAQADDPYAGPILGLNLFTGGGFRPWAANMSSGGLTDLTGQLVFADGEWTLPVESGLVRVASFEQDSFDLLKFGWQFDFVAGASQVILQAEASSAPASASADVWRWVARLVGEGQSDVTITELEVIGTPGLQLSLGPDRPGDQVVWASDGFVYRLTAANINGNTAESRSASAEIGRLRVVDRGLWIQAVNGAEGTSPGGYLSQALAGLITLALIGSGVFFGVRRAGKAALIAIGTAAATFFFVGVTGNGVIPLMTLAALLVGLGLAWWAYRLSAATVD